MKKTKMSLASIQGRLTKDEMKKIMAGSGSCPNRICLQDGDCSFFTSCTKCISGSCFK